MKQTKSKPTIEAGMELREGMELTQEEFHRRYLAYPDDTKIELVGGIVYMSSPLFRPHGISHLQLTGLFWWYQANTPGVESALDMSMVLGAKSEPRPDLMLRLLTECGGQSRYNEEQCLIGAPELVAEVADSTRSRDLNAKKKDYSDAGVQEYIVVDLQKGEIIWFHFPSKRKLKADKAGVFTSEVFPGLWLNGPAFLAMDGLTATATLNQGLASAEHAAFVAQLAHRRARHLEDKP